MTHGYTIQLYMADGTPDGLVIATQFGWTGQITVARQTTFDSLLAREEMAQPGIYILAGPDPDHPTRQRAYIGEADNIARRIPKSARERGEWWELAVAITSIDKALSKGHIRYIEARLIEIARAAGRVELDNKHFPETARRHLPEADNANIERFIDTARTILPVVGLDLFKPIPQLASATKTASDHHAPSVSLTLTHNPTGVQASAFVADGEFVVQAGSQASLSVSDGMDRYVGLRQNLIDDRVMVLAPDQRSFVFVKDHPFTKPSAAAAVIQGRNSNGRRDWRVAGTNQTYGDWQENRAAAPLIEPEDTP